MRTTESIAAGTLLRLDDVSRGYGRRTVLDRASLSLGAGRVAWLRGENGSGKTTLLRVAAGMLAPQLGSVTLLDFDPARERREFQRRLGYVPAGNGGLYARLTVEQHLAFWLSIALVPSTQQPGRLAWAWETLELGELRRQRVDRLSTGQRQRVRLAMGFIHKPLVVLLDEPLVSLDDRGGESLAQTVGELTARGGAVLWCSPNAISGALEVDDRFVLEAGRVVALDPDATAVGGVGR